MRRTILGAMALAAALAAARRAEPEPRLQVSRLSGRFEIETPNRRESVAGQRLPYVRSGSIVRVTAGTAEFRSDFDAVVTAGKGDTFHYTARRPEDGRAAVQVIAAIETDPKSLEIVVGGERFRPKRGGGLSITASGPGEATVRSEMGDVLVATGGARGAGRLLQPGEALIVAVREDETASRRPMSLAGVTVIRKNETTFEARGDAPEEPMRGASSEAARRAAAAWPERSGMVAEAMIDKYGAPDSVDDAKMTWIGNGSWKRTTVYRLPGGGGDVIEQSIGYAVPEDRRADLTRLGLAVKVDAAGGELSSTSESEETNFLVLNLADEVVKETRTPEGARAYYLQTVRLAAAGKSSPYLSGLLFRP
ncbi:MAG: hypothetical protein HYV14_00915 [Elusimicrobia bacterium]|nr:hypothetical protein [Elusimicrobiota bacterium]